MVVYGAGARTTDANRFEGEIRSKAIDVTIAMKENFTREHVDKCPAKGVTCNCGHKVGHFERTRRRKRGNQRGRGAVGMIRESDDNTN